MTDYTRNPAFRAAVVAAEAGIEDLATSGVPDAAALMARRAGHQNLQGHYNAVVPFAVLLLRNNPWLAGLLRAQTSLAVELTSHAIETGDPAIWTPVKSAAVALMAGDPGGRLRSKLSGGALRVQDAATYLSTAYGGSQTSGAGGDTVLKRTVKLVAHMFES